MVDVLRVHDTVLMDGSLRLRPLTEQDWDVIAPWNQDPRVLWFSGGNRVEHGSIEEIQAIYRQVSQHADLFVIEYGSEPIGEAGRRR